MNTLSYTLSFAIALVMALAIIPVVITYARRKQLYDEPGARKKHTEKVSSLGGIGIFVAWALAAGTLLVPKNADAVSAFALVVPLFVVALIDDIYTVGVTSRLVFQALTAVLAFELGFKIEVFENSWLLNLGITAFVIMAMINAFNLIDGINGLAGSLGTVASLVFGWFFSQTGHHELALISFAYAGALVGFLKYNFGRRAKIFMGDNGSVVLGYFMALMTIAMLKIGQEQPQSFAITHKLSFAIVAIPLADMVKVSLLRVLNGRSPFYADRTHIHHLFVDNEVPHPVTTVLIVSFQMTAISMAIMLSNKLFWFIAPMLIAFPYVFARLLLMAKSNAFTTLSRKNAKSRVPARID